MWRCLLLSIFTLIPPGLAQESERRQPSYRWPAGHEGKQKLEVQSLGAISGGGIGYETDSFRFYSDAKISNQDWRSIMIVCEGLSGAMRALPLRPCGPSFRGRSSPPAALSW